MATLKATLSTMFYQAWTERGRRMRCRLAHGLRLALYVDPPPANTIHLLLTRDQVLPALREWQTVLEHWPAALPEPWPAAEACEVLRHGCADLRGLRAVWTMPQPESWIRSLPGISQEMHRPDERKDTNP